MPWGKHLLRSILQITLTTAFHQTLRLLLALHLHSQQALLFGLETEDRPPRLLTTKDPYTLCKAELKTVWKDWMMLFTFSGIMRWARPQLCPVVTGTCMGSLDLLTMELWAVWAQGMEPAFFQPTDIHSWLVPIVRMVWP